MALLAAIAFNLGHRHAVDADGSERLADLVEFEWFDNGNNELHGQAFISRILEVGAPRFAPGKSGIFLCKWHKKLQLETKNNCCGSLPLVRLALGAGDYPRKFDFIASGPAAADRDSAFWGIK